jgi:CPA1 family monovalent cation:H+ antiporter
MLLFELVIGLLFAGAIFALVADRIGVPYPALLAVVGTAIALVPNGPRIELDPELALALFVAPTLLDAAFDASPRDLRRNLAPVLSLAVVLVILTVAAVAAAARWVVPEMGWAPAIALGAIVAPPDASAASAVLRKLRPPHRLLVILEGESLFNDATSLLIYRVAVGAAMTGAFSGWSVVPMLLLTCGGGVVLGWALARASVWATLQLDDIPVSVVLQFVVTFGVWMLADRLGLSAIITVVAYAMTAARRVSGRVSGRRRIASYAVWEVVVLVLNVLAFVLIGLQLRVIVARIQDGEWSTYALCAAAVCAAVVLVRIAWVMTYATCAAWLARHVGRGAKDAKLLPSPRNGALASWCGMRGIVTLAAALALPGGTPGFPHRDLIVFSAYCVVLTTLVLQGATLRPLMLRLGLHDEGTVEREIHVARAETARAALRMLGEAEAEAGSAGAGAGGDVATLRAEYQARLAAGEAESPMDPGAEGQAVLQQRAVMVQRVALTELRARRVIGDDAFHVVEEEIDLIELSADARVRPTVATGGAGGASTSAIAATLAVTGADGAEPRT